MSTLSTLLHRSIEILQKAPFLLILLFLVTTCFGVALLLYTALYIVAPVPRSPRRSEKTYKTILPDGNRSEDKQLSCWMDTWNAHREAARRKRGTPLDLTHQLEDAEVFMSVVVPAYNEEKRLGGMLEEAVDFLQREYGDAHTQVTEFPQSANPPGKTKANIQNGANGYARTGEASTARKGWEILIVSDGSTDKTVDQALDFAREHQLSQYPAPVPGPRTPNPTHSTHIPHGSIRVITLEENRGKGGAVTHGMRHVRGRYAVFADADGASKFDDLAKLVEGCQAVEDDLGRGVAIGSRAHLVGSEAVVKRSKLRNFLMHAFHLLLRLMTPPATSAIKDTQCGFKLFSRPSLPYIIPYMHCEGWIFDVEMLMLAESANIAMVEVAVGWKEVMGSKLNVVWDSLGMAWGLAVLRASWAFGIYRRD
ncbi:glycosyltransferase family 2 protein [Lepidopterella palustris CBS 459.81]|uniref:dolichyl-phosphate beta-glucosyltransferase n=1 Tax=Lepidopterella palustris CBS 459.81 TaxID=1314670 RepID=A0A8E2JCZ5_9PEZI|nr:glycosyltransferase family 2 protein [Lepidopterella palustris CBS 459.81]